jgi:uncharacterized membrane protein YuzA (DUF378 family)
VLKFIFLLFATIAARFVQMPCPNIEPVMATLLPASKTFGKYAGFFYGFIAIAAFDFATGRLGLWTLYTAIAYAVIGYAAAKYFSNRKATRFGFAKFAVVGTLFYDLVTSLAFGWQFHQTIEMTLIGQIPFTAYHLLGNVAFAFFVSPAIFSVLSENKFSLRTPSFSLVCQSQNQ